MGVTVSCANVDATSLCHNKPSAFANLTWKGKEYSLVCGKKNSNLKENILINSKLVLKQLKSTQSVLQKQRGDFASRRTRRSSSYKKQMHEHAEQSYQHYVLPMSYDAMRDVCFATLPLLFAGYSLQLTAWGSVTKWSGRTHLGWWNRWLISVAPSTQRWVTIYIRRWASNMRAGCPGSLACMRPYAPPAPSHSWQPSAFEPQCASILFLMAKQKSSGSSCNAKY